MADTSKKVLARPSKPVKDMTRKEKLEFGRQLFRAINSQSAVPSTPQSGS